MSSNVLWPYADQPLNIFPTVLDWPFDKGPLTRCLATLAGDALHAEPLLEGWRTLCDDEC